MAGDAGKMGAVIVRSAGRSASGCAGFRSQKDEAEPELRAMLAQGLQLETLIGGQGGRSQNGTCPCRSQKVNDKASLLPPLYLQ